MLLWKIFCKSTHKKYNKSCALCMRYTSHINIRAIEISKENFNFHIHARFLSIVSDQVSRACVNERKRHICNAFTHCLRPPESHLRKHAASSSTGFLSRFRKAGSGGQNAEKGPGQLDKTYETLSLIGWSLAHIPMTSHGLLSVSTHWQIDG